MSAFLAERRGVIRVLTGDADGEGVGVLTVCWIFALDIVGSGADESDFCSSSTLELLVSCCVGRWECMGLLASKATDWMWWLQRIHA